MECKKIDFFLSLGASSGIGADTAELFTKLGASVAITGRKAKSLAHVGVNCQQNGEKVKFDVFYDLINFFSVFLFSLIYSISINKWQFCLCVEIIFF